MILLSSKSLIKLNQLNFNKNILVILSGQNLFILLPFYSEMSMQIVTSICLSNSNLFHFSQNKLHTAIPVLWSNCLLFGQKKMNVRQLTWLNHFYTSCFQAHSFEHVQYTYVFKHFTMEPTFIYNNWISFTKSGRCMGGHSCHGV